MDTYEEMARASYGRNNQERTVQGYDIIPELTTDDRVAYRNQHGPGVVIAFRGTDPTNLESYGGGGKASRNFFKSRAFRDVTTDIMMGLEIEHYGSRFKKAETTTRRGIQKYGKENVTVVGHSLGGSQALHVSQKYGVKAVAYNPFIGPQHIRGKYPKATLVHNVTDPISFASPFVKAEKVKLRYDTKRLPTISQHGLVKSKSKPKSTPVAAPQVFKPYKPKFRQVFAVA
jgi:hypothetical protein